MTRVFTEGFELGDGLFFTVGGSAGSTTGVRSGVYAHTGYAPYKDITALSEFYYRTSMYLGNSNETVQRIKWQNAATVLGHIRTEGNRITAYTSTGTLIGTGTIPIFPATIYLIEIYVKIADSGGRIVVKVDGIVDIDFTGDTKPGTATTVNRLQFGSNTGGNVWYMDDLALNDTAGGVDNSWCGEGHVIATTPNDNGDVSQLVGSDGNSVSNYLLVDEAPSDSDTTYVESSTSGQYDLYNLSACGLSNVEIKRVWVEARARDTVAAGGNINLGLKSTNEYWSANLALLTTYTLLLMGTIHTVNPYTSAAWTPGELDALQAGFKVT